MPKTISEAIEILMRQRYSFPTEEMRIINDALNFGIEALKLLKLADVNGGAHTFKGESVEDCIFIRKIDLQGGLLADLLLKKGA